MSSASGRSDALALGLSLGAAATSAYVLWKTTQEPKQSPTDKKLEKKLKQQARSRKIESLIMERGQAGARAVLNHRACADAIEATAARWRGGAASHARVASTPSTNLTHRPPNAVDARHRRDATQAPRTTASTSSPRARRT